jgi:hypothetical protein
VLWRRNGSDRPSVADIDCDAVLTALHALP